MNNLIDDFKVAREWMLHAAEDLDTRTPGVVRDNPEWCEGLSHGYRTGGELIKVILERHGEVID